MLEALRAHRDTLQNYILTTSRGFSLEMLSEGIGRAVGIYFQILQDAVSVLNSMIVYLEGKESRFGEVPHSDF